jgi:hypothetical protein
MPFDSLDVSLNSSRRVMPGVRRFVVLVSGRGSIMGTIISMIRDLRAAPPEFRWYWAQYEIEILLYRLWCIMRGRRFRRSVFERVAREPGKCYLVTSGIPEIRSTSSSRLRFRIIGISFEAVELSCEGRASGGMAVFYHKGKCERCGRALEVTQQDKLL